MRVWELGVDQAGAGAGESIFPISTLGIRVWGLGFRVWGSGFWAKGLGFKVLGSGFER